jgi:hypothetical protein
MNLCIISSGITTGIFIFGLRINNIITKIINKDYPYEHLINNLKTVKFFGVEFKKNYFTFALKKSYNGLENFVKSNFK